MTNLAIALDGIGRPPVIVDASLRESRLAKYLADNSDKGLAQVLAGEVAIEDAVYHLPQTDVREAVRDAVQWFSEAGYVRLSGMRRVPAA